MPLAFILLAGTVVMGQKPPSYRYAPQAKLIPKELGRVYLGMRLRDLAKQIDISQAYLEDVRFEELGLVVPFEKGNINGLHIKVAGVPLEGRDALLTPVKVKMLSDDGKTEYMADVHRPIYSKLPANAFVYAIYITFDPKFDQKSYVKKLYGKGTERDPKDPYHFSDIEWNKRTSDGLIILIRSLHEDGMRALQLLGRIKGTEWSLDD